MEPIVRVSIAKIAFSLEQDAFEVLDNYLSLLSLHYEDTEGGTEIIEGIEERMADLLDEQLAGGSVITLSMVKSVIDKLGTPDNIDEPLQVKDINESGRVKSSRGKVVYRDPYRKRLGGVCAGYAHFFDWDVSLVRILAVALAIGSGFFTAGIGTLIICFLYLILWMSIPPARTIEQQCAMMGERMDVNAVKDSVRSFHSYIGKPRVKPSVAPVLKELWGGIKRFWGLALFLFATLSIATLCLVLFFYYPVNDISIANVAHFLAIRNAEQLYYLVPLSFLLPLIGLIYSGTRLFLGLRSPFKLGRIIFLLTLILWIYTSILVFNTVQDNRFRRTQRTEWSYPLFDSDTLYIKLENNRFAPELVQTADWNDFRIDWNDRETNRTLVPRGRYQYFTYTKDKSNIAIFPIVYISREKRNFNIKIFGSKKICTSNYANWERKINSLPFDYVMNDSLLTIRPRWISKDHPIDVSLITYTVCLPDSKRVKFIEN